MQSESTTVPFNDFYLKPKSKVNLRFSSCINALFPLLWYVTLRNDKTQYFYRKESWIVLFPIWVFTLHAIKYDTFYLKVVVKPCFRILLPQSEISCLANQTRLFRSADTFVFKEYGIPKSMKEWRAVVLCDLL